MKKIEIPSAGSYDKLKIVECEDLTPKAGEVVIDVKGIGINYADVCIRLGVYESAKKYVGWPITPGFETAGVIKEVGEGVTKWQVGQEVVAFSFFNGYASQVCVPETQILNVPPQFSLMQAAGFPAVFFTAFHALYHHVVLRPNSKILVHSAAGGVGTALTQLAKMAGHQVVGVIGSSHKREYLEQFGPDKIIDKSKEDLWKEAEAFSPEGYDIICDANGYTTMLDSYKHLKPAGKLLVYGAHSMLSKKGGRLNYLKAGIGLLKTPKFNPFDLISNNKGVIGFNLSFLFGEQDLILDCVSKLEEIFKSGKIKPIPITEIPFEEVAKAHQFIESGNSVGKIVLKI